MLHRTAILACATNETCVVCSWLTVSHLSSEDKLLRYLLALRVISTADSTAVVFGAGTKLIVTPCTLFNKSLLLVAIELLSSVLSHTR